MTLVVTIKNSINFALIFITEGPMSHDQPTYASVPGIRVYGMICTDDNRSRRGFPYRTTRSLKDAPPFPFEKAYELALTANWD